MRILARMSATSRACHEEVKHVGEDPREDVKCVDEDAMRITGPVEFKLKQPQTNSDSSTKMKKQQPVGKGCCHEKFSFAHDRAMAR